VQFTGSGAWAADNIQANAVLPGWIDTDLTKRAGNEIDGLHDRARTPAARWDAIDDSPASRSSSPRPRPTSSRVSDSRRRRILGDGLRQTPGLRRGLLA
jgi:NAD(P)-dependent dehydrogenase (short-subunit alcohol dehydrogenase family)